MVLKAIFCIVLKAIVCMLLKEIVRILPKAIVYIAKSNDMPTAYRYYMALLKA